MSHLAHSKPFGVMLSALCLLNSLVDITTAWSPSRHRSLQAGISWKGRWWRPLARSLPGRVNWDPQSVTWHQGAWPSFLTCWTGVSVYLPGNALWRLHPWGAVPKSSPLLAQACVSKFCLMQAYLPPSLCDGPLGSQALPGSDWAALPAFSPPPCPANFPRGPSSLGGPSSFLAAAPTWRAASWEPKPVLPPPSSSSAT